MEIDLNVLSKQQVESTSGTKQMRMSEHAQSMVFQMFTKNVYSNPIGTVVREITSNCFDSHIEAGVENSPVLIKKTFDEQTETNYISFIDYGVGMSPDRVENIYGVYFESTKRKTNNEIGGFGIGGKTPLAYKRYTGEGEGEYDNSFFVITNYNGIKYYYTVFEGKNSPEYTLFHSEETNEQNGTEIRIPVLFKDISKFEDELIRQLYYFEGIVFEGFSDRINNDYQIIHGKNFVYRGNEVDRTIHVCLGRVYYPIDYNVLNLNSFDYEIPVAIKVPIGDIGVTVSRESLDYSEQTVKYLRKKINDVVSELKGMIEDQYSNIVTLEQFFELKNTFGVLKLTENKTLRLNNLINEKDIDLNQFKYSEFKTPNSGLLFNIFFNVKTYGKKETQRSYRDNFDRLERNYNGLKKATNVFYSDINDVKLKRIKQSYLRETYGRFYMVRKADLTEKWSDICYAFNIHFDSKNAFVNSKTYKKLLQMQEEYYNIVRKYGTEYENVQVPEDFKLSYGKNKLSSELMKVTVPARIDTNYKERIKIKDLINFHGKIFYGTPEDEELARRFRSLFSILFDSYHLATDYYQHDIYQNKFGEKKGIMIITVAKNNLKYFKHCKQAYPISKFFDMIIRRKESDIVRYIRNQHIMSKYDDVDRFYKTDLFKSLSTVWKNRIDRIEDFINSMDNSIKRIRYYEDFLKEYIDFSKYPQTAHEKTIEKQLDLLKYFEQNNNDKLRFINIPHSISMLNEHERETLTNLIKTVMSL
jgi:hypothetical protein